MTINESLIVLDFLQTRIAEDEQAALAAADHCAGVDEWDTITRKDDDMGRLAGVLRNSEPVPLIMHFARHDPARVLREVGAKRRLIERYERALRVPASEYSSRLRGQDDGYRAACWDAILDAAAVYDSAWRPA